MDSKPRSSRFTVLNSDSDNIYISKSLLGKLSQQQGQQQTPAQSEPVPEPVPVPATAAKKPAADSHFTSDASFSFGGSSHSNPSSSVFSENAHTMPASIDPEYIAKHAQYDSSTHLFALRGEYERKLQQYQQVWRARFDELEHLNEQLFKLNSDKFAKEVSRVDDRYFKQNHATYEVPCKGTETSVFQCYVSNAKKPLLCADEVKKFSECVEKTRIDLLKR